MSKNGHTLIFTKIALNYLFTAYAKTKQGAHIMTRRLTRLRGSIFHGHPVRLPVSFLENTKRVDTVPLGDEEGNAGPQTCRRQYWANLPGILVTVTVQNLSILLLVGSQAWKAEDEKPFFWCSLGKVMPSNLGIQPDNLGYTVQTDDTSVKLWKYTVRHLPKGKILLFKGDIMVETEELPFPSRDEWSWTIFKMLTKVVKMVPRMVQEW